MRPQRLPLVVLFDADCGFCGRIAVLLHRLDRAHELRFLPLQLAANHLPDAPMPATLRDRLHVTDRAGMWLTGGEGMLAVLDRVAWLWPVARLLRLPGLRSLVQPAYQLVADHRATLSRWLDAQACRLPNRAVGGR